MSQPTCHHILANGALCQGAPLRNRDYCRFHLQQIGRRMRAARARARHQQPVLKLPLLEDLYSVQVALMQLADAVAYGDIDPQRARLLTTVLRLAMQNLKSKRPWEQSSRFQSAISDATPTAWDTFEQEHDLPADLDLSLDPEVTFPPTEETTGAPDAFSGDQVLRTKIDEILGNAGACTPPPVTADEVEIVDVLQREGNQAVMQVVAEQQRNRRRRERRARRQYYEEVARNRSIQRAAQKMFDDYRQAEAAALRVQAAASNKSKPIARAEAEANRKPPQSEAARPAQMAAEWGVSRAE